MTLRRILTRAAVAVVLAAALVVVGAPSDRSSAATALDSEEQLFLNLLNQYRQQNGLGTLIIDSNIEDASRWMSTDMGIHNYFSHIDSLGRDPFQRMCDFGYCYNTWKGENLAAGTSSAQVAFDLWKGSPDHNANMLNAEYKVIGIARAYTAGSSYGWYWTTDFGGYIASPPQSTATPAPSASPTPAPTPSPAPSPTATPAPAGADSDGDGFSDSVELVLGTNPNSPCGSFDQTKATNPSLSWPADLAGGTSANQVDLQDLISFLAPVRRLGTSQGDANFDRRWDLVPGRGAFSADINLEDLARLVTLAPPMFGGVRAFGGPSCK